MAQVLVTESYLQSIANAIRGQNGAAATYTPAQMAAAITAITPQYKYGVIRPDAELIQSFSYDKNIVADEGVTLPTYSTTATDLKATETFSTTVTLDYENFDYYVLERFLTVPSYSVTTKAKGRLEWLAAAYAYEVAVVDASVAHALIDTTKFVTSRSVQTAGAGGAYRAFYWSSSSAVALSATNSYGTYQTATAPSISNGNLNLKAPILRIRGHSSYLSSTYYNALTDIRYQYKIDVYRAPKTANLNGWGLEQSLLHILDDVGGNLT